MEETPNTTDEQDRAFVQGYLEGKRDSAGGLIDRYQKPLYNVALRMLHDAEDAEDVTQTVFLNALLKLKSYDPKYRFFSWMYRMTVNESLNTIKKRRPMESLDDDTALPTLGIASDDAVETEDRVGKALMRLKPDDRAVVVLRHFVSFSYEEIAEVLDVPVKTVKSRLFTARERLRLALDRQVG